MVVMLSYTSIDLDDRQVHIVRSVTQALSKLRTIKNEHCLHVLLPPVLISSLRFLIKCYHPFPHPASKEESGIDTPVGISV